jgi:RNA polymerase sigma-70 factor (ECF subfamily)
MSFDAIYSEYASVVYRFLIGLTRDAHIAEELTQECFYRAYKSLDGFNGKCKLSVWLCQIAKNSYFDYCRKAKAPSAQLETSGDNEPENSFLLKENAAQIHRILHALDEPYKEVFMLRVFGELSYRDISLLFEKSENWARVVFFRAKTKISDAIRGAAADQYDMI